MFCLDADFLRWFIVIAPNEICCFFRLPTDHDCHELWSKTRKRKQREQAAVAPKLDEQYPAAPPRSRTAQLQQQGSTNSAKSTPERSKQNRSAGDENMAPNKMQKKEGVSDNGQAKGSLHRTISDTTFNKVRKQEGMS